MQYYGVNNEQHLEHHGILGMKWGVRRYQNPDGSLTEAGKKKYGSVNYDAHGKFKTHKDFVNANKYARADYLQRKEKIREDRRSGKLTFRQGLQKTGANMRNYNAALDKNRVDAGGKEIVRDTAVNAAKKAALATGVVLGAVAIQKIGVGTANRMLAKKQNVPVSELKTWYEYSVGKKEVAKYIAKAVGTGAAIGAIQSTNKYANAYNRYNDQSKQVQNRISNDQKKWKKQKVSTGYIKVDKRKKASPSRIIRNVANDKMAYELTKLIVR